MTFLVLLFSGIEPKDWVLFAMAVVVDLVFFTLIVPQAIERWALHRTRHVRARALRSLYHVYLEAVATLEVDPGALRSDVLRTRILEAIHVSRRRFSDVVAALLPVLEPDAQLKVAEVNAAFTDVLNMLEVKAWRPEIGDSSTEVLAAQMGQVLETALHDLGDYAEKVGAVGRDERQKEDGSSREGLTLQHFHRAGLAVDELRNRVRARQAEVLRRRNDRLFPDLDD